MLFLPNKYSKPLLPYWLQPRVVEKAKSRIAIAINAEPNFPNTEIQRLRIPAGEEK